VTIRYNHYKPSFEIVGGRLGAAAVDAELFLSHVFKQCTLELHSGGSAAGPVIPTEGGPAIATCTFVGLVPGETYWVGVVENAEEAAASAAREEAAYAAREAAKAAAAAKQPATGGSERRGEGCSCIWGNPCVDEYVCKDWANRFAVAAANGCRG
jgi:hypothetical protein